jgi:uncharacterized protein
MSIAIDVRDLIGRPGASRHVHVEEPIEGLRTELTLVHGETPVDAELLLESVIEGILASGGLSGTFVETCARCLEPFEQPFRVDVQELFAPGAEPDDLEEYPLRDGESDLEPMIRDAVVLAMPYSPLCRPDCQGICERCGGNRNLGECTCQPPADERWAPLAGLVFPDEQGAPPG